MLKLSQKGSYGLKTVLYISKNPEKIHKIKDISTQKKISETLLRRIIAELEKAGILKTIKGRNGGVILGMDKKNISIYDILVSLGENLAIRECSEGGCSNEYDCESVEVVRMLQNSFNKILKMYSIDRIK